MTLDQLRTNMSHRRFFIAQLRLWVAAERRWSAFQIPDEMHFFDRAARKPLGTLHIQVRRKGFISKISACTGLAKGLAPNMSAFSDHESIRHG